ncbi:hypothetical protein OF83DRAFT_1159228, partial [Amylostereum chailletii]
MRRNGRRCSTRTWTLSRTHLRAMCRVRSVRSPRPSFARCAWRGRRRCGTSLRTPIARDVAHPPAPCPRVHLPPTRAPPRFPCTPALLPTPPGEHERGDEEAVARGAI